VPECAPAGCCGPDAAPAWPGWCPRSAASAARADVCSCALTLQHAPGEKGWADGVQLADTDARQGQVVVLAAEQVAAGAQGVAVAMAAEPSTHRLVMVAVGVAVH